jgi:hypothetical protein
MGKAGMRVAGRFERGFYSEPAARSAKIRAEVFLPIINVEKP